MLAGLRNRASFVNIHFSFSARLIFFEINYHAAYEPQRAVRTKRWKYIRRFDGRDRPALPNCDNGLSKSAGR